MLAEKPSEGAERSWREQSQKMWSKVKSVEDEAKVCAVYNNSAGSYEEDCEALQKQTYEAKKSKVSLETGSSRHFGLPSLLSSSHQSSNLTQDLHQRWLGDERRGTRVGETCHFAPSSIFISFLNIVARSLIFIVNVVVVVVSAGGIPLGNARRLQHLQRGYSKQQQTFRNRFPGINWIYPTASSSSSSNSHLLANTHTQPHKVTGNTFTQIHSHKPSIKTHNAALFLTTKKYAKMRD